MAEATLNDVITRMKEEGLLTRNSGTNSLKSAISEIKGVRSDFKGFFNNFGSALQNLGSTQKEFSDMMKSNFEKQQEALASQQRNDALADEPKPTETDDNKGAISKLLESIKKMIPKKSPGLIGLLFGGLAAAFLLFPEWVKSNLILPLVDVINVLQGKNATTTLGAGIKHLKDLFGFINDNFGPETAWILGITSALAVLNPIRSFKIAKDTISGLSSLVSWAANSSKKLLGFKGVSTAADAALDATGGGPPNRPKKLGPLARLSSAISNFGKNIATKATEIAGSSKNIIKNLGSMIGKAAGKAGAGGSGLLKLGGTLLRLGGPAGLVVLGVAGIALAADKLRNMNIDSTVKDISDKNATLKAAIASGNKPLVETLTAELATDLKRLQDTTIGNVASVQEQIKLAQNTLAEEATKNLAISLAKLQEKSIRNADGSVAEGAAEALHAIKTALNKQVQELLVGDKARTPDQIKEKEDKTLTFLNNLRKDLNDNKISPEDQKEVISRAVEQILKVRAASGGIARGSTLASELSNVQDTNQTLEQMFKTLDRLSKNNNLKFETTGKINGQADVSKDNEIQGKNNGQAEVLANSGNPSSQTSPVVPIVAPTTNNTDNTRVVNNYYFYNDGSIDAAGRYSGMRLPVGF
jgi:hypothetical protein